MPLKKIYIYFFFKSWRAFSFSFLTTSNFGFISVGVDGALSSSFTIPPPPLFYFIVLLHCCTVHTRPHYTILFGLATVTCVSPALSSIASKRAIQDTHEIDKAETELRSLRTIDPAPVLSGILPGKIFKNNKIKIKTTNEWERQG